MRPTLVLLTAMFAVLACGTEASPAAGAAPRSPLAAPTNERLYLGNGSALTVVDGATGEVERTMPAGAPSPDWSRLYSIAGSYANVKLRLVDAANGEIQRVLPVPDWVSDARLSANGRWLALVSKPDPKATVTRFQLRDAELTQQPIDVELPGAFAFDGLSGDGRRLYLLQFGSRASYQVRLYDMVTQQLMSGAIADKSNASTVMSGGAVNSLTTADGQTQLTLYERDSHGNAFVHVLPIGASTQFAYCVDLPAPGVYWALTPAPDGRRFYAANLLSGSVLVLTARGMDPPQVSSGRLDTATGSLGPAQDVQAKEAVQRTAATVSTDGATLFVGAGATVTRVDASTLRAGSVGRWDGDQVLSLAAGHSGWLYALTASGRLLRIDPRTMSVSWRSGPRFIGLTILHQTG